MRTESDATLCEFVPPGGSSEPLPVGVDDLAEGQLATHLQVALMFREISRRAAAGIHLTVLV